MIGFEGVSKQYRGGRLALDDVTLSLPAGGSLGLVGESGSGKTTGVRLARGVAGPNSGRLTLGRAAYPARRAGLRGRRRGGRVLLWEPFHAPHPGVTVR